MGNRVKGRPKKKGIKAAIHSGMATHRKLSRMGKVQKRDHAGLNATFIGRAKVLKKLQISLKDFRRLCILKGVYPREPRGGRAPRNKKGQVFYHIKDVKALAHEPLLEKFREFKSFMKKVRRSANRNEKDEARRKQIALKPSYTLHRLVRERYPRFADALGDLDDALCLVNLFACLPSEGRVKADVTRKAQRLAAGWGAYCAMTGSITRSFVSVKGVYLEADIMASGQAVPVRWVMPHSFTQHVPEGVDFRVMLTFFEFYETLLSFVLFKLYGDVGIRYPLPAIAAPTDPALGGKATSVLAATLRALQSALDETVRGNSAVDAVRDAMRASDKGGALVPVEEGAKAGGSKASKKKHKELMRSIDEALKGVDEGDDESDQDDEDDEMDQDEEENGAPIAAPLREALDAIDDSAITNGEGGDSDVIVITDPAAQKRRALFRNMTFFLSREVPRGYLEVVILSYGGKVVGWEAQDSPISMDDPSITHHVVDRPKLLPNYSKLPKSREYVQPQWVLDCANFDFLLPVTRYGVGAKLPPHLSPWDDAEGEGYVPKYKEEVEKMKNGEVLEYDDSGEDVSGGKEGEEPEVQREGVVGTKDKEDGDEEEVSSEEEEDENAIEDNKDEGDSKDGESTKSSDEEDEDEDDEEAERMVIKKKETEDEEAARLAKALMSKKSARLYGRMQHGIAKKQARVDNLHKKRREIESTREKTKEGKSMQKLKVERLKKERKEKEGAYADTGGSMKKRKKN